MIGNRHLLLALLIFLPSVCKAQTFEEILGYGLPVVMINTVDGEEPTAELIEAPEGCLGTSIINATKVPGRVRIYNPDDSEHPVFDSGEYVEGESGMTFKIRGNTSATSRKKAFKIKLQKKADMLTRGDKNFNDKEWALIRPMAGRLYPCPIVAMLGWQATKILRVSDWVPASQYVNLIVNGDFRGFYQLTETVKRNDKCRIDVDEQTGYITEIDPYWWNEDVSLESEITGKTYRFTFKYPDSDDITQEQLEAFGEYVGLFNASIKNGTYPLYIDVESCARWLLAHQILGTLDSAGSNVYFLRRNNQSRLQMGPLWDFDSILQVSGSFTSITKAHYFKAMLRNSPNKTLAREMIRIWEQEKESFLAEISKFYESLAGTELAQAIDKSTKADLKRWPGKTLDDMDTTIDKLRNWFPTRAEEIDSLLTTLNTEDGAIQWENLPEGAFVLNGTERPVAGSSLFYSSLLNDMSQFSFRWTRGDALGNFNETDVLSTDSAYIIADADYEHWLRATVCDKAGNAIFSKDTWISKLPVLYIDTDDGNPITSKINYVTASIRIQGNADYEEQYAGTTEIRGRGQTSWRAYPQKPYKLKFSKKANLFGYGKSKHWVLLSNFNDKSCLRNYTASRLAKQLNVLGMDMTWVDVVINGEVKGCYMLSQHIRADKNSVDIFDWEGEAEDVADALFYDIKDAEALEEEEKTQLETAMKQNLAWITDGQVPFKNKTYNLADYGLKKEYDISNGYLFEATQKSGLVSTFTTPDNIRFELTAPEYLKTNTEMMTYVTDLWKDFEAGYCQAPTEEGKPFGKYADMESMVGVWLTDEIMGQDDYANSHYSYITEDKKIHFGPVWDFDHGGGSWSVTQNTTIFYTLYGTMKYKYYKKWFPDPELCLMAFDAYWNVARPFIMDYISEGGEMDTKYAHFADAGITNDIIWGGYPNNIKPSAEPLTTAEDVEILKAFLLNHIKWLDTKFQSVKTLVESMNKYCTYPCSPDLIDGIASPHPSPERKGFNKIIKDKHLYIIRDGETYSIDGKRIK